jgi:hypothetical protein
MIIPLRVLGTLEYAPHRMELEDAGMVEAIGKKDGSGIRLAEDQEAVQGDLVL